MELAIGRGVHLPPFNRDGFAIAHQHHAVDPAQLIDPTCFRDRIAEAGGEIYIVGIRLFYLPQHGDPAFQRDRAGAGADDLAEAGADRILGDGGGESPHVHGAHEWEFRIAAFIHEHLLDWQDAGGGDIKEPHDHPITGADGDSGGRLGLQRGGRHRGQQCWQQRCREQGEAGDRVSCATDPGNFHHRGKLTRRVVMGNLRGMTVAMGERRTLAVVLNWCAEEDSAACVASLLADETPGLELLIADSASPDGSGDRLAARFPGVAYLQTGANLGYAGGNLLAMEWALARGFDYVLVINDDAEVRPGCVGALIAALEGDARAAACAPTVVHGGDEQVVWWGGGRFVPYKALGVHHHYGAPVSSLPVGDGSPVPVTFLSGCVVLFRLSALRAHGGFRAEYFAYVEDAEWSWRLTQAQWSLLWVPAARAVHKVPFPAPPPSPFGIEHRDRNRRRVAARYGPSRWRWAVWFWGTRMIRGGQYLIRGDYRRARSVVVGAE